MKKFFAMSLAALVAAGAIMGCSTESKYETVPGDPLNAQLYTLSNGLKVYMTVNRETPRIQTYIAVRAGGKNDPAETTGLAHYFEHLMFKGTEQFGTQDYAAEKPLLDEIEALFEIYRKTTDEAERKELYRRIDSVSYEASKYAIPNEYDKLMSAIGANGTNAYTSYDVTCYTEDIPSNQIDNWARIQADRFKHNVIRGFHTELEAVYEEKNISLTKDTRKVYAALFEKLFPSHPYGTQTVLGTQEQLKNPSIVNIKNFYNEWYVPNNIAICMSGDFDPDQVVAILEKYFGDWAPNPNLPKLEFAAESDITAPIDTTVLGPEQEMLWLGWRLPGAADHDIEIAAMAERILSNGQAGLMDLDLNLPHRVLAAQAGLYAQSDYSAFLGIGLPMPGQSLDEVRALLLEEIAKLRRGEFDEELVASVVNEYKLAQQKQLEDNSSRADMFVDAFINHAEWSDACHSLERMSRITKQQIVDFANRYLKDDNFVAVNKVQGDDPSIVKMEKPAITPIATNRDAVSDFVRSIQESEVKPIEPVFVDFKKDITFATAKQDIPVLYRKNDLNGTFELIYVYETGSYADPQLAIAAQYLDYLGTADMTPEEIQTEFYKLGCSYRVSPGTRRTYVLLSGLSENFEPAVRLFEKLLAEAEPAPETYQTLLSALMQSRMNNKQNQSANFSALRQWVGYGGRNLRTVLRNEQLAQLDPAHLTGLIKSLSGYQHRVLYYGPAAAEDVVALLNQEHRTAEGALVPAPAGEVVAVERTTEPMVFLAPYEANNIYMSQVSVRDEYFDPAIEAGRILYNEYFGGGMNSIVFQEMREARGLAYSAFSTYSGPSWKNEPYTMMTYIITQNDKLPDAAPAFSDIVENMPVSEAAFKIAKEGIISRMRTERTVRSGILWAYVHALDLGLDHDLDAQIFNEVQNLTIEDVQAFHAEHIKGRSYHTCILGDEKELDSKTLRQMGTVRRLTTEEIFGY